MCIQMSLPTHRTRLTPGEECSCSVLYFTSGDIFNKNIRIHTVEMGFTVNMPASHPLGVTGQFTPLYQAMLGRPFPENVKTTSLAMSTEAAAAKGGE